MIKTIFFTILIMFTSMVLFSFANATDSKNIHTKAVVADSSVHEAEAAFATEAQQLFSELNLDELGLSPETVNYAVEGYQKLADSGLVNNPYLTIVDFSQSSRQKRFYIIDMKQHQLVWNTFVSHGKNSGVDMASHFSNQPNSEASSLGFYITKTTYSGKHGMSLRISGLEEGFNDNAEARGIVVHGASYVNKERVNSAYMGRSQGCPALPENEYAQVIDIIKGGSVMFIYSPESNYLTHSPILSHS